MTGKVPLWSDQREALEARGLHGSEAIELARRLTAPARHAARVEAAKAAARAATGNHGAGAPAVLCLVEAGGIGGRAGCGTLLPGERATVRLPAFSELGKGRHQAGDGPAWTAAIAQAGQEFARIDGPVDAELVLRPALVPALSPGYVVELASGSTVIGRAVVPPPWLAAVARRAIARAILVGGDLGAASAALAAALAPSPSPTAEA